MTRKQQEKRDVIASSLTQEQRIGLFLLDFKTVLNINDSFDFKTVLRLLTVLSETCRTGLPGALRCPGITTRR